MSPVLEQGDPDRSKSRVFFYFFSVWLIRAWDGGGGHAAGGRPTPWCLSGTAASGGDRTVRCEMHGSGRRRAARVGAAASCARGAE